MSVFNLDKLREAMLKMQPATPVFDSIAGSGALLNKLEYQADANGSNLFANPIANPSRKLFGMDVLPNRAFPHEHACPKCGGSGEGLESTYCSHCKGAGRIRIEGAMMSGGSAWRGESPQMVLITSKLPRAFEVRWSGGDVPRRPSPGIRAIDWP